MRLKLLMVAGLTLFSAVSPANAVNGDTWSIFNINGNDTGGIIPWTPDLRAYGYREAAQRHCEGYHKIAHITSVTPHYGNYVGFECAFPRDFDPVGHGNWWMAPIFKFF